MTMTAAPIEFIPAPAEFTEADLVLPDPPNIKELQRHLVEHHGHALDERHVTGKANAIAHHRELHHLRDDLHDHACRGCRVGMRTESPSCPWHIYDAQERARQQYNRDNQVGRIDGMKARLAAQRTILERVRHLAHPDSVEISPEELRRALAGPDYPGLVL